MKLLSVIASVVSAIFAVGLLPLFAVCDWAESSAITPNCIGAMFASCMSVGLGANLDSIAILSGE